MRATTIRRLKRTSGKPALWSAALAASVLVEAPLEVTGGESVSVEPVISEAAVIADSREEQVKTGLTLAGLQRSLSTVMAHPDIVELQSHSELADLCARIQAVEPVNQEWLTKAGAIDDAALMKIVETGSRAEEVIVDAEVKEGMLSYLNNITVASNEAHESAKTAYAARVAEQMKDVEPQEQVRKLSDRIATMKFFGALSGLYHESVQRVVENAVSSDLDDMDFEVSGSGDDATSPESVMIGPAPRPATVSAA